MNPRISPQKEGWCLKNCFRLSVCHSYQNCFESAVAITLRFQLCSARYSALHMKSSRRGASATIQSLQKYDDSCTPTINYCLESAAAIALRFQLCSAHYTALQTKNSVRIVSEISPFTTEIRTIPVHKCTVGKSCIALPRINTLGCRLKEMGHKGGQR